VAPFNRRQLFLTRDKEGSIQLALGQAQHGQIAGRPRPPHSGVIVIVITAGQITNVVPGGHQQQIQPGFFQ
jgi:hypothetical protein